MNTNASAEHTGSVPTESKSLAVSNQSDADKSKGINWFMTIIAGMIALATVGITTTSYFTISGISDKVFFELVENADDEFCGRALRENGLVGTPQAALFILECETMTERNERADSALAVRTVVKLIGLMGSFLLFATGGAMILARIRSDQIQELKLGGSGPDDKSVQASLSTQFPGLIVIAFGVILGAVSIIINPYIVVNDNAYLGSKAGLASASQPSAASDVSGQDLAQRAAQAARQANSSGTAR